jgi:hypothetical protein
MTTKKGLAQIKHPNFNKLNNGNLPTLMKHGINLFFHSFQYCGTLATLVLK